MAGKQSEPTSAALMPYEVDELIKIVRATASSKIGRDLKLSIGKLLPSSDQADVPKAKREIDFKMMEENLSKGAYASMDAFKADVNLIYDNIVSVYDIEHTISQSAASVRKYMLGNIRKIKPPPAPPTKTGQLAKKPTPFKDFVNPLKRKRSDEKANENILCGRKRSSWRVNDIRVFLEEHGIYVKAGTLPRNHLMGLLENLSEKLEKKAQSNATSSAGAEQSASSVSMIPPSRNASGCPTDKAKGRPMKPKSTMNVGSGQQSTTSGIAGSANTPATSGTPQDPTSMTIRQSTNSYGHTTTSGIAGSANTPATSGTPQDPTSMTIRQSTNSYGHNSQTKAPSHDSTPVTQNHATTNKSLVEPVSPETIPLGVRNKISTVISKAEEHLRDIVSLSSLLDEVQRQGNSADEVTSQLRSELAELHEEVKSLGVEDRNNPLTAVLQKLQEIPASKEEQIEDLQEQVDTLQAKMDRKDAKMARQKTHIEKLERELQQINFMTVKYKK